MINAQNGNLIHKKYELSNIIPKVCMICLTESVLYSPYLKKAMEMVPFWIADTYHI